MKHYSILRRFIASLLLLVVSTSSWAYDANIDGIYYNLVKKAKTAIVTSGDENYSGDLVIPSTVVYEGVQYTVTSIDGIWCSHLTYMYIPETITSISEYSDFSWGIDKLEFTSLESIMNLHRSYSLRCDHLYIKGQEIKDLIIPDGTTSIGDYTFHGFSGLTSVTIPNSVTTIGDSAFEECSGLTSLCIPEGVTTIGYRAFYDCTGISSVVIPNSVTYIDMYAFASNNEMDGSNLKSVTIGNGVNSIARGTFQYCTNLTSVTIGSGVETIEQWAFAGCTSLESIYIPDNVEEIDESAFNGCSALKTVTLGSGVKNIGGCAFGYCEDLEVVYCFAKEVPQCGETVMYNSGTFFGSYVEYAKLYVPASSLEAYKNAEQWKEFGTILPFDPTAVEGVKSNEIMDGEKNTAIYDLMGRRLKEKPASGYYIQGGKKFFAK